MWLHIHWEYFIFRNLILGSVKKKKKTKPINNKDLCKENIAFLKFSEDADPSWIVSYFDIETGFCVKVRKSHIIGMSPKKDLMILV